MLKRLSLKIQKRGKQQAMTTKAFDVKTEKGAFVRAESVFRNWIENKPDAEFPAKPNRYVIYFAYACPWASRTFAVRNLLGLQDVIEMIPVEALFQKTKPEDPDDNHFGWAFSEKFPDPLFGASTIRDIYERQTKGKIETRFTVPLLFDKEKGVVVSNESADIIQMLNSEFTDLRDGSKATFATNFDLNPKALQKEADEINEEVYHKINNGVYRCGFATSQEAYEKAVREFIESMHRLEGVLSKRRYLLGDRFTLADVRLFVTLIRQDSVYRTHFKTISNLATDFPNLWNYTREIYQMKGIAETVNMPEIVKHYYGSHLNINTYGIVPVSPFWRPGGSDFPDCAYDAFLEPHDRERDFDQSFLPSNS